MKLSEYIKNLKEIEAKHGDLKVIYAKDEEGNGFTSVHYDPTVGKFRAGEFYSGEDDTVNAVCVN